MRSRLLLLGCLLFTGCVDAVDDDDATPDDVADDDDTPAYQDGPGPPAAGHGVCEEVRSQSAWCIAHGALGLPSRAVGLDDGVVCEVDAYVVAAGRSSIGMAGDEAAAWLRNGVLAGNLASGEGSHRTATNPEVDGITELSGGWVALQGWREVAWYPDLEALALGAGGTTLPWEPFADLIGGGDTHLIGAGSQGDEVAVLDVVSEEAMSVPLQGFDGPIDGVDYLPGDTRFAVLSNRDIYVFEAETGAPAGTFQTTDGYDYLTGLSCHGPAGKPVPTPTTWTVPNPAATPSIGQCDQVTDQSRWCVYRGETSDIGIGLDDGAWCFVEGGPFAAWEGRGLSPRVTPTADGVAGCQGGVLASWDPTGTTLVASLSEPCFGLDYDDGAVLAQEQLFGPLTLSRYADFEALRAGESDWTTTLDGASVEAWVAGPDRVYVTPTGFGYLEEYALPSGEHIQTRPVPWAYGDHLAILASGELMMVDLVVDELVMLDPATLTELQRWPVADPSEVPRLNCYPTR